MPLAIQYGMTENQFWHGDMRLFSVYQKAYLRDKSEKAYLEAQYQAIATEIAINNAFAQKKSDKQVFGEVIKYIDPFEKLTQQKEKITKDNLEKQFRQDMLKQQMWLRNALNSKKE